MAAYDDAVAELYQAPHAEFVAERKRLSGELKAAGDKAGAARFSKLGRPTISAWTVNQLWWHAREAFDALLETAAKLRKGKLDATAAHREAIAKLRARAAKILGEAGHGATEGTLRKVTQTLAALAATGTWDPDPPGALAADRDPPGFEAIGIASAPTDESDESAPATPDKPSRDELADMRTRKAEAEAAERAAAAEERKRVEVKRAQQKAERHRLEAALRTTRGEAAAQEREVEKLRKQLADAEDNLAQAEAVAADLQAKLEELEN